jgi:hypothetical protein
VRYRQSARGWHAPIRLHAGGADGPLLATGLFKAPLAAFSNAKSGADSGFFTIYARSAPRSCSGGEAPSCGDAFTCEPRLGKIGGDLLEDGMPCLLGSRYCRALEGGGLCVDTTSSAYEPSSLPGLVQALVWRHAVGNADPIQHERYYTRTWDTNKFTNLSARTVRDFDPSRPFGQGNDYRPAVDAGAGAKLLLWGRPGYIGSKRIGRDLELYFAFVELPSYSASASFEWAPRYFAGLSSRGVPQFSDNQADAKPLDLGGSPAPQDEVWDVVNQMSVSWVAPLERWVMLYGGGANEDLADFMTFGQPELVEHDPDAAIKLRFARHPFGPWTAPEPVLAAGNPLPLDAPPAPGSQYEPAGILRHPQCRGEGCAPTEPSENPDDYGFLYGANVIDVWTETTPRGADLYWNVSTWHPYQVVLLKTSLHAATHGPAPDAGAVQDAGDAARENDAAHAADAGGSEAEEARDATAADPVPRDGDAAHADGGRALAATPPPGEPTTSPQPPGRARSSCSAAPYAGDVPAPIVLLGYLAALLAAARYRLG